MIRKQVHPKHEISPTILKSPTRHIQFRRVLHHSAPYATSMWEFVLEKKKLHPITRTRGFASDRSHEVLMNNVFLFFRNPYSTQRNSRNVLKKWRLELPYKIATLIQTRQDCQEMMKTLGYKPVLSNNHLSNISQPLTMSRNDLVNTWIDQFMLRTDSWELMETTPQWVGPSVVLWPQFLNPRSPFCPWSVHNDAIGGAQVRPRMRGKHPSTDWCQPLLNIIGTLVRNELGP